MRELVGILAAAALGATAMYYLDRDMGAMRRARTLRRLRRVAPATSPADWRNKRGHEAAGEEPVPRSDAQLRDAVRSRLGRLVSFPGAVEVQVDDCVVRLTGDVLYKELDGLLSQVRDMKGVRRVINALSAHDSAEGIVRARDELLSMPQMQAS